MAGTEAGTLAATIYAAARTTEEETSQTWAATDMADAYWCMIDLRASSAFRLAAGEKAAFIRMRTFVEVYRALCDKYAGIDVFKEMGDALLIRSQGARGLCEVLALADGIRVLMEAAKATDPARPSLEVRSAISFGSAFQHGDDFFGASLDRVARISRHTTSHPNVLAIAEDVVRMRQEESLTRELPFLSFELDEPVGQGIVKPGERDIRVSALIIDRASFARTTDYFSPIRSWLARQQFSLANI